MSANNCSRPFAKVIWGALLLLGILLPISSVQAYKSNPISVFSPKLPGSVASFWVFYDYLDSKLSIFDSNAYATHALNQWNISSTYTMFDIPNGGLTNTKTNNTILVADFLPGYLTACGNVNSAPSDTPGFTCALDRNVVLNSNIILKWNTSGLMSNTLTYDSTCSCYRKKADFLTVLLHELGHIWTLAHPTPTTPVMYAGWTTKSVLTEDDKRGATQFYGPHTGWEKALTLPWFPGHTYTETLGNENVVLSQHQVSSPQLTPRPAELSVTPYSGSRHLKIYGIANNVYSYAYMKLFTANDDELADKSRHLTIANGTQLSWYQYNSAQKTMSIDIIFSDGTTLRGSGLTDQNGVGVHPAARNYPTGSWYFISVNLSSLAGKRVQDIVVAYDNGGNGVTGTYRAYFDKLDINY